MGEEGKPVSLGFGTRSTRTIFISLFCLQEGKKKGAAQGREDGRTVKENPSTSPTTDRDQGKKGKVAGCCLASRPEWGRENASRQVIYPRAGLSSPSPRRKEAGTDTGEK